MYPTTVYVGTTSESRGTGLARMRFDPETGEITRPELAVAVADPATATRASETASARRTTPDMP